MATLLTFVAAILVYGAAAVVMLSPVMAVAYMVYAIIRDKKEEQARREFIRKNW